MIFCFHKYNRYRVYDIYKQEFMATEYDRLSAPDLDRFNDAIRSAADRFGGLTGALKSLEARGKLLDDGLAHTADTATALSRAQREYKAEVKRVQQEVKDGLSTSLEAKIKLQDLADQFKNATSMLGPEAQRDVDIFLTNQKKQSDIIIALNEKYLKYTPAITLATTVLGSLGKAAGSVLDAYKTQQTDIQMAGSVMSAAGQAAASSFKAGSEAALGLGNTLSGSTNKKLQALGTVSTVAGGFLKGAGVAAEVVNKAMPLLTAELEKNYKAFNDINSTGAVFAGGLQEMNTAALGVSLTLPEFSAVIKENSASLAASGMGMTGAAKQMGAVGTVMRQTGMADNLRRLGIEYKDQAGLIADSMANFAAAGKGRGASDLQLAQYTEDYAKNLKVLSGITGEDAKKAMEKNRRAAFDADVYAKLSGSGPEAIAKFQTQLALFEKMDPTGKLAEAYKQQVAGITDVTDPAIRKLMEIPGVSESLKKASDLTLDGNVKMSDATVGTTTALGQMREAFVKAAPEYATMAGAARAGVGGVAAEIAQVFGNVLAATGMTPEAAAAAKANVATASTAQNKLTEELLGAAQAGRDLALAINNEILNSKVLINFAKAVKDTTESVTTLIQDFGGGKPGGSTNPEQKTGMWEDIKKGFMQDQWLSKSLGVAGGLAMIGGAAASVTGVGAIGGIPLATIGGVMEGIAAVANAFGFAQGGIAAGPKTGYLSKLHGTEAVIPLPEGMKGNDFFQSLLALVEKSDNNLGQETNTFSQSAAMPEIFQKTAETSLQTSDLMKTLVDKMQELIDVSKDVANYTELTSARVS
jgi:hypothetical protein